MSTHQQPPVRGPGGTGKGARQPAAAGAWGPR